MAEMLHDTFRKAAETLSRRARGDFRTDEYAQRFPVEPSSPPKEPPETYEYEAPLSLLSEWEQQALADGKPAQTIRDFCQKVADLSEFTGGGNLRNIQPKDMVRWANHLRDERSLASKTISQKYIAAVKVVFSHAKGRAMGIPDPTEGNKAQTRQEARDAA